MRRSVHLECQAEENKHRWIESEKAKQDLGEASVRQWVRDHWDNYLRARWIEHLEGKFYWIELDRDDFGLLQHIPQQGELFETIVNKLKAGEENLTIINWWKNKGRCCEPVHEILELLDCNSRRLRHRFEEPCLTPSP
jgi:uncharacterized protein (DUF2249 family)